MPPARKNILLVFAMSLHMVGTVSVHFWVDRTSRALVGISAMYSRTHVGSLSALTATSTCLHRLQGSIQQQLGSLPAADAPSLLRDRSSGSCFGFF